MTRAGIWVGFILLVLLGGCGRKALGPAQLDNGHEPCAWCRMVIADPRCAAQWVAPSEEPLFFDDIGCLFNYLNDKKPPRGGLAFVAEHRTRVWLPARSAVFTRAPKVDTPMNSHLLAHADAASRDADPDARGGTPVDLATLWRQAP